MGAMDTVVNINSENKSRKVFMPEHNSFFLGTGPGTNREFLFYMPYEGFRAHTIGGPGSYIDVTETRSREWNFRSVTKVEINVTE